MSPGGSRWTNRRKPWPEKPLFRMVPSSSAPPAASGILVQSLCAATGCEVDLASNNQITKSGLDLGYRNRHRSLTHALMIFSFDSDMVHTGLSATTRLSIHRRFCGLLFCGARTGRRRGCRGRRWHLVPCVGAIFPVCAFLYDDAHIRSSDVLASGVSCPGANLIKRLLV